MDLKGALIDTNLRIIPSKKLLNYIETISEGVPETIAILTKDSNKNKLKQNKNTTFSANIELTDNEVSTLNKVICNNSFQTESSVNKITTNKTEGHKELETAHYLSTLDLDWLYIYLQNKRKSGKPNIPYLHELLEGSVVKTPENRIIKRNPDLEARCVKLRSQQEAREYRKMTKTVDNVRIRYPEDSISYQLKQINRQLIAIGQFIISIFAGFLFGFRGIELMVDTLDFGFRLLLGVMCALIIALAEIYFLAKKLNEELLIQETVQLGGPPMLANSNKLVYKKEKEDKKEHQD